MSSYPGYVAIGLLLLVVAGANDVTLAQRCNPAVDGTYCASADVLSAPRTPTFDTPRYSLSQSLGPGLSDQPGTIGAISFGTDGSRCIALMRRSRCKD